MLTGTLLTILTLPKNSTRELLFKELSSHLATKKIRLQLTTITEDISLNKFLSLKMKERMRPSQKRRLVRRERNPRNLSLREKLRSLSLRERRDPRSHLPRRLLLAQLKHHILVQMESQFLLKTRCSNSGRTVTDGDLRSKMFSGIWDTCLSQMMSSTSMLDIQTYTA
jgi:hypothetical protein